MLLKISTSTGISASTAQAPWVNLVTPSTTITTAVSSAPRPLISTPRFQPGSRRRRWRRTMPLCESVNEMNTPIA